MRQPTFKQARRDRRVPASARSDGGVVDVGAPMLLDKARREVELHTPLG